MAQATYNIKLQQFEGPFDLLLFFIERDEIDINNIPISTITQDFLDHIKQLENLNLNVASEFILVAATLMRIKARTLIPRKTFDEEGNEIDPRHELVQKLIEYKQFKEVVSDFRTLAEERDKLHLRGNRGQEVMSMISQSLAEAELDSVSITSIFKAFRRVMIKYELQKNRIVHKIVKYPFTIKSQTGYLNKLISTRKKLAFTEIFKTLETRMEAIVTFLAMLEMVNQQVITIQVGETQNSFWIQPK